MAGKNNKVFRIPKNPIPKPKKIITRGLYELISGSPRRDYGKRLNKK